MFGLKSIIPVSIFLVSLTACQAPVAEENADYKTISGEAQGTTYQIKIDDPSGKLFSKQRADSIFKAIDQSLSVWVPSSVISHFNSQDSAVVTDAHFLTMYFRGEEINAQSGGAFEPMIMPLVRAWGFGPEGAKPKGNLNIDSLLAIVHAPIQVLPVDPSAELDALAGFEFVKSPGQSMDVNGIAQGYTVDVLAEFVSKLGIENFMIEVGGEVRAQGVNAHGKSWTIGIDKPIDLSEGRELQAIAHIKNKAIATSGSYRKFYEVDGRKYSHTINPTTGKPVDHQLLSATVMAPNCTNADAFATVFMVKGVAETKAFIQAHPELELEVFLIFNGADGKLETYVSPGLEAVIEAV